MKESFDLIPNEEPRENSIENQSEIIILIKNKIEAIRALGHKAELSQIHEIRDLLDKLPNLVINFDDTITKPPENPEDDLERKRDNFSIRAICREVISLIQQPQYSINIENA